MTLMILGACLVLAGTVQTTSSRPRAGASDTVPLVTDTIPVPTDSIPVTEPVTIPETVPTTVAPTTTTQQVQPIVTTSTIAPAVLPAHTLPSSGSDSTPVIVLGVVLLAMGLTLTVVSRARQPRATS